MRMLGEGRGERERENQKGKQEVSCYNLNFTFGHERAIEEFCSWKLLTYPISDLEKKFDFNMEGSLKVILEFL